MVKELDIDANFIDIQSSLAAYDVVIVAVPDDTIRPVCQSLGLDNFSGLVVHTSGAQSIDILQHMGVSQGVFYPLQTFSKEKEIDFTHVPWLLEAKESNLKTLKEMAMWFGGPIIECDSVKRLQIHLAAVFACNFTNHLYKVSEQLLKNTGADLHHLAHLMQETVEKAISLGPTVAQTGPAKRHDQATIEKHLKILQENPDTAELYKMISQQIIKDYQ